MREVIINYVSEDATIGENVTIGRFSVIESKVSIGKNSIIGNNVIIHSGSIIGENVRIDDNSVIGKDNMKAATSTVSSNEKLQPCNIGDEVIIGSGVVIYKQCNIGAKTLVADLSTIRENVKIGSKTIIGRGVAVENFCTIGSMCKIETNAYITAFSAIEDYVFIAPGVVTSNDNFASRSKERLDKYKGVTIKRGGRVGAQATILPGKVINEDAFVAAGSVVTKDVEEKIIVAGNPARKLKQVPENQLLINQ